MPYMDKSMAITAMQERTEKRCQSCREILPLGEFHADRSRNDGHDTRCKPCAAEHAKTKSPKTRKPGGGRKPLPADKSKNKQITLRLPPDLYDYLKSLPPGSAERILREHHTRNLIV